MHALHTPSGFNAPKLVRTTNEFIGAKIQKQHPVTPGARLPNLSKYVCLALDVLLSENRTLPITIRCHIVGDTARI